MLTVKLTAEQLRNYKGPVRAKILSRARAQARRAGEATLRIVRPNGGLLEQLLTGVEQTAKKRSSRPRSSRPRSSRPSAGATTTVGLSRDAIDSMRQSVEATAKRHADKQPKVSDSCRKERHFMCDGKIAMAGVVTGKGCECSCHRKPE